MEKPEEKTDELSRRDFLKASAAAGAFALFAGAAPAVVWAAARPEPDLARLGELVNPYDVAIAPDGTLYVANAGRYGVVRLAGDDRRYLGGAGTAEGCFNFPMGVDAGADGSLFVADTNNGRVQVFGADGDFQEAFGRLGYLDGEFLRPKSVCAFGAGVLVADTRNHRVQYVDLKSRRLVTDAPVTRAIYGGLGDAPAELKLPRYVAAYGADRIYVSDAGHNVVKVFSPDGRLVRALGEGELNEPAGIALAVDGAAFVADAGAARVLRFDRAGQRRRDVAGFPKLTSPRGLALWEDLLFVADAGAARIAVTRV